MREMSSEVTGDPRAARAVGRGYGAMFFSVFGGAWFLLATYAFGRLNKLVIFVIVAFVALFVITARRLQRRGKQAAINAFPAIERQRNNRVFGIVNAVTWMLVAVIFQIMPRLGHPDLAFPTVVLLVGLHFFVLPPLYRHRANLLVGAVMVVWAMLCPLFFTGDRMIGFVAAGAGVILWAGAAWALRTAGQLLRSAGL
jgi:hypothetical protein